MSSCLGSFCAGSGVGAGAFVFFSGALASSLLLELEGLSLPSPTKLRSLSPPVGFCMFDLLTSKIQIQAVHHIDLHVHELPFLYTILYRVGYLLIKYLFYRLI